MSGWQSAREKKYLRALTSYIAMQLKSFGDLIKTLEAVGTARERQDLVDRFLHETGMSLPIIEGNDVYFVYKGKAMFGMALAGDMNNWDTRSDPMERIPSTDLYYRRCQFPSRARIEYKFIRDGEWILDPLNPRSVSGDFGPNSVLEFPDYAEATWLPTHPKHAGKTHEHSLQSDIMKRPVRIGIHVPYGFNHRRRYSVLYVLNGDKYRRYASIEQIVDLYTSRGDIKNLILAMLDFQSKAGLLSDYGLISRAIAEEFIPFVEARYPIRTKASERALIGSSFEGGIPFVTVLNFPTLFGNIGCMSGYLSWDQNSLLSEFLVRPQLELKGFLSCGTFETNIGGAGSLIDSARLMRDALVSRGYCLRYEETPEGHNWTNWKNRLPSLLLFFYGAETGSESQIGSE